MNSGAMGVETSPGRIALVAIGVSLLGSLFFSLTYVLNRANALDGGYWAWMASLRYLITLPLMLPLVWWQGGARPVLRAIAAHPWAWIRCGAIGFVLFYSMLCFAAASGPAWLVAGTFLVAVVTGMLCAPFLYTDERRRIPRAGLVVAVVILFGVLLMQVGYASWPLDGAAWLALACVLVAAFAFPLGNRLLLLHLERTGEDFNATQRVFGMTLASQPLWILLAVYAGLRSGAPPVSQVWMAAAVALASGVIATILFFQATGMVRNQPLALGGVEAMQASEVLFAMLLGVLLLGESWPGLLSTTGALVVIAGIVVFAWVAARPAAGRASAVQALRTDKGG